MTMREGNAGVGVGEGIRVAVGVGGVGEEDGVGAGEGVLVRATWVNVGTTVAGDWAGGVGVII